MAGNHSNDDTTLRLQNVNTVCQPHFEDDNETNIPISVLEEIAEEGEHSIINPKIGNTIEETSTNNSSPNTSFSLPSEFLHSFDSIFSLGSLEFSLNKCAQKRLTVGLTSSGIPNLTVIFKLHDTKNDFCVTFDKKQWNKIVQHEMIIFDNLNNNSQQLIYLSDHLKIETVILYNRPCVAFSDITDNHCTLALETFEQMMLLKSEIEETYNSLKNRIRDVTKRMALFMDMTFFLLFKSNNIDHRHNYNSLMLAMDRSSDFMDLSSSVAHTWKKLGEWIGQESTTNFDA